MPRLQGSVIEGKVVVKPHAVEKLRMRKRDGEILDSLSDHEVAALIASEVRAAVAAGQVFDTKPRQFRLYGQDGSMPPWQRFIAHPTGDWGYVIGLDYPPDYTVVTTLIRASKVPGY